MFVNIIEHAYILHCYKGYKGENVRCRTNKARYTFNTLKPIWRCTALSVPNKIRIFNTSTNVKSILLYGSGTWRATKTSTTKLQSFINRCLRNILNFRRPEVVSNKELWTRTKQAPIETEIKKRKWSCNLVRPHTPKACMEHHEANPGVESPRKKEGRSFKTDLAKKYRQRNKSCWYHMGRDEEDQPKPSQVENSCCGPVFYKESRGLN
ncbi:hypothetical protein EGW08_001621 [Elysia chlorotica]|uniref:DUF6451 domain-containing protein n=1 Tax=Elysia chlorotica TaxID=188477 RepID=A0A3S1A0E7_ELYCH|nr:hypothetical protein EGW08_001621 [Elysia chlorotica]